MRHHQQSAVAAGLFELAQEGSFALRVHRTGGLVHQQDLWLGDQAAGQRHKLPLATGQERTALAHGQIPAQWVGRGHTVQARQARSVAELAGVGCGAVQQHVVAQRAGEQTRLLRHIAHTGAKVSRVDLAQVHAVNIHQAFTGLIKPRQYAQHRALARANAAQYGDPLTGLKTQGHGLQHLGRFLPSNAGVGKTDIDQCNAATELTARHVSAARLTLHGLLHHTVQRTHGRTRALVTRGQLHHTGNGRHCAASEHHRANQGATADEFVVDQINAPHQHHQGHELL